jgi:hypothetical protein
MDGVRNIVQSRRFKFLEIQAERPARSASRDPICLLQDYGMTT